MKVVPIIPALNPDDTLIRLTDQLAKNFNKIIIVDDGSEKKDIFNKLDKEKCIILIHDSNKGKGEALKTAFSYYLENMKKNYCGVVCLDADGQHLVSDVVNMSELLKEKDQFILGTRLFNTKETPFRNKLGNHITSHVFGLIYKKKLKDTQTGLRAIPNRLLSILVKVAGSHFEYELNVLIKLVKINEDIQEYNIKTVYLKNSNKKSHFKVLRDSYQIYKIMFQGTKKDL